MDAESETLIPTGGGFDVAGTLNANGKAAGSATQQDPESGLLVAHNLKGEGHDGSQDGTGRGVPIIFTEQSTKGEVSPTLTSSGTRGRNAVNHPCVAVSIGLGSDPLHAYEVTQPITNRNGDPGTIAFGPQNSPASDGLCESEHVTPTLDKSKIPAIAFSSKDHGADASTLAPTLQAMGHNKSHPNAGGQVAVAFTQNQAGDILAGDHSPAMGTNQNATGRNTPKVMRAMAVRRLTPRECERLQGFPDDYTLITYRKKPAADGPRYKVLGNSMAVPVMKWIGRRIHAVDQLEETRGCKR